MECIHNPYNRNNIKRAIGIKYDATGISGYFYRSEKKELAHISSLVVPNPDIFINGYGYNLCHKSYDYDITLVPGIRRVIVDTDGIIKGYYEYKDTNIFYIVGGNISLCVTVSSNKWTINDDKEVLGELSRIDEAKIIRFEENGLDMEMRFKVSFADNITGLLRLLIMAVPMLGF